MMQPDFRPPARRRLFLMRHGSVDYFPDGRAADPLRVPLTEAGRLQADAAGRLLAAHAVRIDRVIATGLPRTRQTAERVLAALPDALRPADGAGIEDRPDLQEFRAGDLAQRGLAAEADFLAPFHGLPGMDTRYLGGESVGELLARTTAALERLLADPGWDCALLVLHGGVNRALLSWLLTGSRTTLVAGFQQAPACLNAVDVATGPADALVRFVNLAPWDPVQRDTRDSTMETLYRQYLHTRGDTRG